MGGAGGVKSSIVAGENGVNGRACGTRRIGITYDGSTRCKEFAGGGGVKIGRISSVILSDL